ncbi:hydrolase [Panus rudis PR-1116 ss-1]|nr:hydrolase [Panus rudis PR-1116 ss-1]
MSVSQSENPGRRAERARVAVVQFAPKLGRVDENIRKVSQLCAKLQPRSVDLVCLPEMAFTGYMFPSALAITPYLEDPLTGPTSSFCATLAKRLSCYVMAGYPERLPPSEVQKQIIQDEETGEEKEVHQVGANSAVVYGPEGTCILNYRKTNLFRTDRTWAKPGTGLATLHLPAPLHTITLGICNDLNPHPPSIWTSLEDGPYEIAQHCIDTKSRVLIMLNAWLASGSGKEVSDENNERVDWTTINYWAVRMRPLWADDKLGKEKSSPGTGRGDTEQVHETFALICNRCGEEDGTKFAGSSALFSLRRNSGKPRLINCLDRYTEGITIWNI